jgi:V/A-type H+-transporting ATPase subunit A
MSEPVATARVVAVQESLVTIAASGPAPRPFARNEVIYVRPRRGQVAGSAMRLKGEILRVRGGHADAQVFESTRGVGIGDPVEQTGQPLSVTLGPGLLGRVFDGLQNDLRGLAAAHGVFLERGAVLPPLDATVRYEFVPRLRAGQQVRAGQCLGTVREGAIEHRILAPVGLRAPATVSSIGSGVLTLAMPVARLTGADGRDVTVTMAHEWPVRVPYAAPLFARRQATRVALARPLETRQRIIDTFFPIARGGAAAIPGPFGAGKTVLQNLIARFADVDVVVLIACGERAGEVVEVMTQLPHTPDPRTGGALMDRTVIIANTSSMPVAAREASMYTGITIGEYYRQMGHDVLVIADSTSRWAQALRETSGRLEEIPGEEAFPAYLDSSIRAVYERAGAIVNADGAAGSLTLIGTVSPAGGNFDEPVTQSTLSTVKVFLGLSAERAYRRRYPAIDPLQSWSRYGDALAAWYAENVDPAWSSRVEALRLLMAAGEQVRRMMQVTGEDGVSLEDYVTWQKAQFVDFAYLQQDANDPVDAGCPLERQAEALARVADLTSRACRFADREAARQFFERLTGLVRNWNYARIGSTEQEGLAAEIDALVAQAAGAAAAAGTPATVVPQAAAARPGAG